MKLSFDNPIANIAVARGATGVWQLATIAAIWPYVLGPLAGWWQPQTLAASCTLAISMALTLVFLIACRATLEAAQTYGSITFDRTSVSDPDRTTTGAVGRKPDAMCDSDDLGIVVDAASREQGALLALFRFANQGVMAAYDPVASVRIMDVFEHRLVSAVGKQRVVAKLDACTFAVWMSNGRSIDAYEAELRSLAYVLTQEIAENGLTVAPDIHAASARFPVDANTAAGLCSHATASLLPLKRFLLKPLSEDPRPGDSPAERFALEQALRHAVRDGQLSLRYQPLIDTAVGQIVGAEVLLRWRHPGFGDVSPALFVPLLEQTGLIHEIGLWTLNTACRQLRAWRREGRSIKLAINLSAVQLEDRNLKLSIARTVESHGLSPSDVEFELTETAAMQDQGRTIALFQHLRDLGFGIAIDDFGNGHSNLGYLKNLPITKLKIDREFVSHIDTSAGSLAICKALTELGAGLGISVLAEGVERFEEVTALQKVGCRLFQGYYFGRPMSAEEFSAQLDDATWMASISSDVGRLRSEIQKRIVS